MKRMLLFLGLSTVLMSTTAFAGQTPGDIMAVLKKNPDDFNTLTILLEKAGTADFLRTGGPYTLLAPTDKAFDRISRRQLLNLSRNKDQLQKFLAYLVIPAKLTKADLKDGPVKTMRGTDVVVKLSGQTVTFNRAKVVKADIPASNGVIHAVSAVIYPMVIATKPVAPKPTGTTGVVNQP